MDFTLLQKVDIYPIKLYIAIYPLQLAAIVQLEKK